MNDQQASHGAPKPPAADSLAAFASSAHRAVDRREIRSFGCGEIVLYLAVMWLLNATLVPGVNESHYLPKAKHAWDPSFAPGDLFLASGNAHWLFSQIAGPMTWLLPLTAVAWIGRVVSWLCMAFAWQRCAAQMRFPWPVAALVLAGWIVAVRLGNWAGEWAIGGFEAKSLAYPFVILALAELLGGRWNRVWLMTSVAVAFHPLVGGWSGVTFAVAWLWFGRRTAPLKAQIVSGGVAAAISTLGILPALSMIGGPSRSGDIVVAQIHAFYRLAHHQSPRLFNLSQHVAGACSLLLLAVVSVLIFRWRKNRAALAPLGQQATPRSQSPALDPVICLLIVAWMSVAVSLCGLLIDLVGVRLRPDLAASLLRFYWFRWSDVMVPLGWVSGAWTIAMGAGESGQRVAGPPRRLAARAGRVKFEWSTVPSALLVITTIGFVGARVIDQWHIRIAPADQTLLMEGSSELASGPEAVLHWQAVCAWVAARTPSDALFLTPRAQQTFKWYAGRAEVVCFKDVPQDSRSLLEWYDRVGRCAPPRNARGEPLGWTTAQLKRLHARYGFHYVIVDRRIQREPPLLETVYPLDGTDNPTYAVFKLSDIPKEPSRTH